MLGVGIQIDQAWQQIACTGSRASVPGSKEEMTRNAGQGIAVEMTNAGMMNTVSAGGFEERVSWARHFAQVTRKDEQGVAEGEYDAAPVRDLRTVGAR